MRRHRMNDLNVGILDEWYFAAEQLAKNNSETIRKGKSLKNQPDIVSRSLEFRIARLLIQNIQQIQGQTCKQASPHNVVSSYPPQMLDQPTDMSAAQITDSKILQCCSVEMTQACTSSVFLNKSA